MNTRKSLFSLWQLVASGLLLIACATACKLSLPLLKTSPSEASPLQTSREHLNLPGTFLISTAESKEIVRMKADGSEKKILKLEYSDFALSPNGKKIVFVRARHNKIFASAREARSDLYVADADGTNERKILTPKSDYPEELAWSPDNKKIAFTLTNPQNIITNSQIWIMNSDGTGLKKLTHGERDCFPCFSPNGKEMVFASGSSYVEMDEHRGLYLMDVTGKNRRPLTTVTNWSDDSVKASESTYGDDYSSPTFSHDGKFIAFAFTSYGSQKRQSFSAIYMMNTDGTHRKKLTVDTNQMYKTNPRFSPDDKFIAFLQQGTMWGTLWITRTDGTSQRVVPHAPSGITFFDWH